MQTIIKHGRNAYVKYKCRCEICRQETLDYKRQYRVRKGKVPRRLDAEPLIARLERDERLAALDSTTISKWRHGGIDVFAADRWSIRLGYHPLEIWGQDFYVGVAEMDYDYE